MEEPPAQLPAQPERAGAEVVLQPPHRQPHPRQRPRSCPSRPTHLQTPNDRVVCAAQARRRGALHLDLHSLQGPCCAQVGHGHLPHRRASPPTHGPASPRPQAAPAALKGPGSPHAQAWLSPPNENLHQKDQPATQQSPSWNTLQKSCFLGIYSHGTHSTAKGLCARLPTLDHPCLDSPMAHWASWAT